MTHRTIRMIIQGQVPVTTLATVTVTDAARLMKQNPVGAVMVVDDAGQLVGVFTERDALYRVLAAGCDGAPEAWIPTCYQGIGTYVSGATVQDPADAIAECNRGRLEYQPWC